MQAVPTPQREKLFNTYMQAVNQLQAAAKERAERARAGFQVTAHPRTVSLVTLVQLQLGGMLDSPPCC